MTVLFSIFIVLFLIIFFVALVVTFQRNLVRKQENFFRSLVNTQEEERQRIGRDLHDTMGPLLSSLRHYLTESGCTNSEINTVLREAQSSIRMISHNLCPPGITSRGLGYALIQFQQSLQTEKINLNLNLAIEGIRIHQIASLNLYRIITELISNALKHSGASQIDVSLSVEDQELVACVADDGCGMELSMIEASEGLGWQSVNHRIQLLGGKLNAASKPSKTSFEMRFSLNKVC